jgi:hypothetical protein
VCRRRPGHGDDYRTAQLGRCWRLPSCRRDGWNDVTRRGRQDTRAGGAAARGGRRGCGRGGHRRHLRRARPFAVRPFRGGNRGRLVGPEPRRPSARWCWRWPATTRSGATVASMGNWSVWDAEFQRHQLGLFSAPRVRVAVVRAPLKQNPRAADQPHPGGKQFARPDRRVDPVGAEHVGRVGGVVAGQFPPRMRTGSRPSSGTFRRLSPAGCPSPVRSVPALRPPLRRLPTEGQARERTSRRQRRDANSPRCRSP